MPPNPLRRMRNPALLVLAMFAYGTAGYMLIEHWSLLDAFFMTLITLTTIGYEEVHRLSDAGRLFTSTLILGGVGTMLWAIGVFTETLSTGELVRYRRRRATEANRRYIRDHFIVCGYGRMGTQIARELDEAGVPHIVIDNNPEVAERLHKLKDEAYIEGDAASEEVLRQARIQHAQALISAVDSDERAVYVVLAARALNPDLYILARAGQPESLRRLELAGANRVVSPYRMAGHQLAQMALRPNLVDVMDSLLRGGSGVEEVLVGGTSSQLGKTLEEAGLLSPGGARVLALRRRDGELHVSPSEALWLEDGDLIVAHGSEEQLEELARRLR
jgi:voltage-gated potassium channel